MCLVRDAQMADKEQDDLYVRFKTLQRQLEFIEIQVRKLCGGRRSGHVCRPAWELRGCRSSAAEPRALLCRRSTSRTRPRT